MTEDEARQRFVNARVARLGTVDANDHPHLVPVCFAFDEQTDRIYSAVDAKPKTTPDLKRLRNIERNPQVTLLVDHYEDDWTQVWWIRVDGMATVHDALERGRQALAAKYPQYTDALLGRIIAVEVRKWASWAYSDSV